MVNRRIKLKSNNVMQKVQVQNETITKQEFIRLHEEIIMSKSSEGLASRTIEEHKAHLGYFIKYLDNVYQSNSDCIVIDENILRGYVQYMVSFRG